MYLQKSSDEILRQALSKLASTTDISATTPGSVARSLVELVSDDLGDFFSILDFNMRQSMLSTATGRALDLWGTLYSLPRKNLSDITAQSAAVGAFYFYTEVPAPSDITIPLGTRVYTADSSSLGQQYAYTTTENTTIGAGRLRAYAPILNVTSDTLYVSSKNTLTKHNFIAPPGVTVKCTNPKIISALYASETDDDYRTRLIAETRRQAGGTAYALRFSALAISGVRNVIIREATQGMGSAEVVISVEDFSQSAVIVAAVQRVVNAIRPVGVRVSVRQPTLMRVDVGALLSIKRLDTTSETVVLYRAKNAILRYLNKLTIGEEFVYNRLVSEILDSSDEVIDVSFSGLGVNGAEILRKNYLPKEDEQLIPGSITTQV